MVDDGSTIDVYCNSQLVLSHSTAVNDGDRIHLLNRRESFADFFVELDSIEIKRETVDLKANGSDETAALLPGESLTLTADLIADPAIQGDTWILAVTTQAFPFNLFSYNLQNNNWVPWIFTFNGPSAQGAIPVLDSETLLQSNGLPGGFYSFFLGYDATPNRRIDAASLQLDGVSVYIGN